MVLALRALGNAGAPRRSTVVALALTLLALACTSRDEPLTTGGSAGSAGRGPDAGTGASGGSNDDGGESGAGASGGSPVHGGEPGAGAGGVAGHEDIPSGGGSDEGGEGGEAGGGTSGSGGSGGSGAPGGEGGAGGDGGADTDPPPSDPSWLPCEVETVLRQRCQSCHSRQPASDAMVPLMTYADLTAKSKVDPSVTVAARSLKRITDAEFPMPPAPVKPATNEEIAILQAWVEAGKPPGSCDGGGGPTDPYDVPPVCTSDNYWTGGTSGSPWMMPGRACIACHKTTNNHAPRFAVAGTVFPTAHEPDTCYGVPATAGAVVIITDANGVEQPPIPVTGGGNFNARWTTLAVPYRAKLVWGDSERVMLTPQTSGDCNGCHTQSGAEGARGRIILP